MNSGLNPPRWLEWAREIQALSQTGYHYAENEYQRQRYQRLTEIAAEIISEHTSLAFTPLSQIFQGSNRLRHAARRCARGGLPGWQAAAGARAPGWRLDHARRLGGCGRCAIRGCRARSLGRSRLPGQSPQADRRLRRQPSGAAGAVPCLQAGFPVRADRRRSRAPARRPARWLSSRRHALPGILSGERTRPRHIQDAFQALQDPIAPPFSIDRSGDQDVEDVISKPITSKTHWIALICVI